MGFWRIALAALCVVSFGSETMASNAGKKGRARTPAAPIVDDVPQAGTGNLSKLHREELVRKIGDIRRFLAKSSDTNAVRLIAYADELAKEVKAKKYGLVFEEHKERVDVELERNLPLLTENKRRFIDNGGELNFLIEGDNLAALKLPEKTHRGKIALIYIDPPYNTGNKDFVYNDSYVDANDTFRHSKWLSFMKKRLEIARKLLTNNGVIFVSIDDNEQAQLRCILDSLFGESNFTGNIIWQSATDNNPRQISTEHEYVVCYCKNKAIQGKWLIHSEKADLIKEKYLELTKECKTNEEIQKTSAKNVYKNYPMSAVTAKTRSTGEVKFEKWCERASDWFYRNGDKGDEYFLIVYEDNAGHQRLFYPDYILSVGGGIWIIEVKGNFNASGGSENIDIYAPKKAAALKAYCLKHGIRGGFACYDEGQDELLFNEESFSEDKSDRGWKLIEDAIEGKVA